jgi:hypothetical protein
MDITWFIPTLGRSDSQTTMVYLRAGGMLNPTLVVQPHEYEQYRMKYPMCSFMRLPKSVKGISATRQYILENCETRYFAMLDDDLRFSRKDPADRTKLKETTHQDMADLLAAIKSKLQRYAHVGVSLREGNNRKESVYELNERIIRAVAYDKQKMPPSARFDRVPLKQDLDMTLQLLRAGLPNCCLYEWAQDQVGGSNARGGCSTFRNEELSDKAAQMLHDLHPDFVTLVRKTNNNWKGFGNKDRLETRIAWKQAYEAGRKARAVLR